MENRENNFGHARLFFLLVQTLNTLKQKRENNF